MKKDEEKVKFPPEMVPVSIINGAMIAQNDVKYTNSILSFIESFLVFTFFQIALFCVAYAIVSGSTKDGKVKKPSLYFASIIVALILMFIKSHFFGHKKTAPGVTSTGGDYEG